MAHKVKISGRLILSDHCLINPSGHNWNYTYSIAQQAIQNHLDVIVVSHINLSYQPPVPTMPWFSVSWNTMPANHVILKKSISSLYKGYLFVSFLLKIRRSFDWIITQTHILPFIKNIQYYVRVCASCYTQSIGKLVSFLDTVPRVKKCIKIILAPTRLLIARLTYKWSYYQDNIYSKELYLLLKKINVTSDDHIFIPNLSYRQLIEFWYVLSTSKVQSPYWHIMLREDLSEIPLEKQTMFLMALKSLSATRLFKEKVQFYVDTKELQKQYNDFLQIQTTILPIPVSFNPTIHKKKLHRSQKKILTIGYFGAIDRWKEKGFHHLPKVLERLTNRSLQIKFIIQGMPPQTYEQKHFQDKELIDAFIQLKKYSFITFIPNILSENEYQMYLHEADIVILPYTASNYRVKSSGILAEALFIGKVVVVPKNTSLESMANLGGVVAYNDEKNIPSCVEQAIIQYKKLSQKAFSYSAQFKQFHSPKKLLDIMLNNTFRIPEQIPEQKKQIVLLVIKEYMIDEMAAGNRHTLTEQIQILKSLGFEIVLWFGWPVKQPITINYIANIMALAPNKIDFLQYQPQIQHFIYPLTSLFDKSSTLTSAIQSQGVYALNSYMHQMLKNNPPYAIIGHYIFTQPIIKKIKNINKNILCICETHDMQVRQYIIRNNLPYKESIFIEECKTLDSFDKIVAVADDECVAFRKYLPNKVHLIPPPMNIHYRTDIAQDIDLLFVGSSHALNKEGIEWFYHNIFPLLNDQLILHIVGALSRILDQEIQLSSKIRIHGTVDNISDIYMRSKIVIVPILTGTGISIKTLEAFSYGKAIVTTSVGLRGIENAPIEPNDTPIAFAKQILKLYSSPNTRHVYEQKALAWATHHISPKIYQKKWLEILN